MICQGNRLAPKAVAELQKAKSLIVLLHHGGKQCFSFQSLIIMLTFSGKHLFFCGSPTLVCPMPLIILCQWLLHVSWKPTAGWAF